jgi:hypothetical protein
MTKSRKKKAPIKSALLMLLRMGYLILDCLQGLFDWAFWLIDRPKTPIWRELKNQGGGE